MDSIVKEEEEENKSVTNHNFIVYKSFLLNNMYKNKNNNNIIDLSYMFYYDLLPGIYIAFQIICKPKILIISKKYPEKTGFYEDFLLIYSKNENKLIYLISCDYIKKKIDEIFNNSFLTNKNILILEKIKDIEPIWTKDVLDKYFNYLDQFKFYDNDTNNYNRGVIKEIVKESLEYYLNFNYYRD